MKHKILAIYDVRGIQDYIYRSSKLKDAKGASKIVEDIFNKSFGSVGINVNDWYNDNGPVDFKENDEYCQILYVGGGNAYAIFLNEDKYKETNKKISKYIIENTYSLQLVSARVFITGEYQKDFELLRKNLAEEKDKANGTSIIGALPIMKIEVNTGLPILEKEGISKETKLKQDAAKELVKEETDTIQELDKLVFEKGVDSTLAVIHIDGNNMAKRIKEIINKETDYISAINTMRKVSFNINTRYKDVFNRLKDNSKASILKVVIAGDDVTYICTGKYALQSVEFFTKEINEYGMLDGKDEYKFSVCAGIAYFHSHFPFYVAYDVAEKCCESAKERAKSNIDKNGSIPNYVDFHICKNALQAEDFEGMRLREYVTPSNEKLLLRPYHIYRNKELVDTNDIFSYDSFKRTIEHFLNADTIARSKSKNLRNIYPLGASKTEDYCLFLKSRNIELFGDDKIEKPFVEVDGKLYAKWYDALEMLDLYDNKLDEEE